LANVGKDEGDFTVAEGHGHYVRDGARVRHGRTTGPGPAKTAEGLTGCDGGQQGRVPAGPVRAGHGRGADWL